MPLFYNLKEATTLLDIVEDELLKHIEERVITPYPSLSIYGPEAIVYPVWDLAKVDTKGDARREAKRLKHCYRITE